MDLVARDADYKTAEHSIYRYIPSEATAITVCVLFSLATAFHLWKLLRTRTWFFIPFVFGGIFEAVGYGLRSWSASQSPYWTELPYVLSTILLLLAAPLFAASMYMMLGRIISMVGGEEHSIIRRTWLTKIFVVGDVLCFVAMTIGGSIQSSSNNSGSSSNLGKNVVLGGLIVQVVFFCLFIVTSSVFHFRLNRAPTEKSHQVPWRSHMLILYSTNALILLRSIFRVVEYAMGNDGYLMQHEVFLYLFDAAPMLLVMTAYVWKYPNEITEYLRGDRKFAAQSSDVETAYQMHVGPLR